MMKVDKKMVLTALSGAFAVGSFVVNILTKNDEANEIAKKAAKIVMDQQSKHK